MLALFSHFRTFAYYNVSRDSQGDGTEHKHSQQVGHTLPKVTQHSCTNVVQLYRFITLFYIDINTNPRHTHCPLIYHLLSDFLK